MGKITRKLIKNFIIIIGVVVIMSFIGSSIFLSKIYMNQQYKELKLIAEEINNSIENNISLEDRFTYKNSEIKAVIIKENKVTSIGRMGYGMSGHGQLLKMLKINDIPQKGKISSGNNETFLFYSYDSKFGKIVVFKNKVFINEYLNLVYLMLIIVFILGIIISIPVVTIIGKKLTEPIVKLKNTSDEIAKGNFDIDLDIKTNDEIEDLSKSLKYMTEELNKKYKLQKDFIANVSHDFKTPLSIIRNYGEAINDDLLDSQGVKEYSSEIINEVDRLNGLVIQLMELSKLQSEKIKINKEYFNIKDLVTSISNKLIFIANEKKIEIIVNSIEVWVYGDQNSLSRVIYNFIDNAIKFSKESSKIEISTLYLENNELKVSVKDYGIGMKPQILNDIWDRYYKDSQSGGMGLGLAISKEILKLHEFKYGVESKKNKGSDFYFIVPPEYIR